jgi:hypothetical protein
MQQIICRHKGRGFASEPKWNEFTPKAILMGFVVDKAAIWRSIHAAHGVSTLKKIDATMFGNGPTK